MTTITLKNYAEDRWVAGSGEPAELRSAVTGDVVARSGRGRLQENIVKPWRVRLRRRKSQKQEKENSRQRAALNQFS